VVQWRLLYTTCGRFSLPIMPIIQSNQAIQAPQAKTSGHLAAATHMLVWLMALCLLLVSFSQALAQDGPVDTPAAPATAPAPAVVAAPDLQIPASNGQPRLNVYLASATLVAFDGERQSWRLVLPFALTRTGIAVTDSHILTAEAATVVVRNRRSGAVETRLYLSGPVTKLEALADGLSATVALAAPGGLLEESFRLTPSQVLSRVTFPPSKALLQLEDSALRLIDQGQVAEGALVLLTEASKNDPSNPFLLLYAGALAYQVTGERQASEETLSRALTVAAPFFVSIRQAALLEQFGHPELVQKALEQARKRYAQAGYDPGFMVSATALQAWGDPLGVAKGLLAKSPQRAEIWLNFLRTTMPHFSGASRVYREFGQWLELQGRSGEASDWYASAQSLSAGTPLGLGEDALALLQLAGLVAALVGLLSWLLLQLALAAKYWRAQGQDLAAHGGRWAAWSRVPLRRLRLILASYQSFSERIVALLLLLATLAGLVLWDWGWQAQRVLANPVLQAGTFGGLLFWDNLPERDNPANRLLRALAKQLDGQPAEARLLLEKVQGGSQKPQSNGQTLAAGQHLGAAQNNLGVLRAQAGDQVAAASAFDQAARLGPNDEAPRLNLAKIGPSSAGRSLAQPGVRASFHQSYRKDQWMLSLPSSNDQLAALLGGPDLAALQAILDPWAFLTNLPWLDEKQLLLPPVLLPWLRGALAIVVLVWLGGALLWLLVPRARSARQADRGWFYHLLALLLPGSSLADEAWGLLLLVPWVLVMLAGATLLLDLAPLAPSLLTASQPLGLSALPPVLDLAPWRDSLLVVLLALYGLNFLGWLLVDLPSGRRERQQGQASAQASAQASMQANTRASAQASAK
jgi:hypothetical protein